MHLVVYYWTKNMTGGKLKPNSYVQNILITPIYVRLYTIILLFFLYVIFFSVFKLYKLSGKAVMICTELRVCVPQDNIRGCYVYVSV